MLPISWSEKNYHVRSVYALNEAGYDKSLQEKQRKVKGLLLRAQIGYRYLSNEILEARY
jgi:hypothetical protein